MLLLLWGCLCSCCLLGYFAGCTFYIEPPSKSRKMPTTAWSSAVSYSGSAP